MREIGVPSGAPLLVIIYIINLFLTNFGAPMYLAYSFFIFYGAYYVFIRLHSGHGFKLTDKRIFFLHFILISYVLIMYSLYATEALPRGNIHWWNQNSTFKSLSLLTASFAVLLTPIRNIIKSLVIIRNFSYFMIFESFIFYLLSPFGENFLSSDFLSSHRFNGGVNSYIITGQLLLAGFVAHLQLSDRLSLSKLLGILILFTLAIIATKDRTTILSLFIILALLFYRMGFEASPFLFKLKKSTILSILIPAVLVVSLIQVQQLTNGNLDAYKSTLNRAVLTMRSIELFKESFPFGYGPGSQTYLMYDRKIDMSISKDRRQENIIQSALAKEVKNWEQRVNSGEKNSPHNTYFDYLVPYGALGLWFVVSIWLIQIGSLKRLLFGKESSTNYLDSFIVSSMVFFIFSSLSQLIWLYLIYYRMLRYKKLQYVN